MRKQARRRSTIAKEWQLAVLRNVYSASENPTEDQLLAAAAETGLDGKWVRNWFTRQRSKAAARTTKGKLATTEPRQQRAQVPTFKLDLRPDGSRDPSTSVDPTPSTSAKPPPQPSLVNAKSHSPHLVPPAEAIAHSYQSISAPTYFNNPSTNTAPLSPTYPRDPLCNRYPDFSQFFLPQPQERPPGFELPTPIDDHNQIGPPLTTPNIQLLNPLHSSPAYLRPCPVAFSMRLVDLLSHPRP